MDKQREMSLVYCVTSNMAEAKSLGKRLVENKLAACVNIVPNMTSIYEWEGKIEEGEECILLVKSTNALVPKIFAFIKDQHSYQCPAIFAIDVKETENAYLNWIQNSTAK